MDPIRSPRGGAKSPRLQNKVLRNAALGSSYEGDHHHQHEWHGIESVDNTELAEESVEQHSPPKKAPLTPLGAPEESEIAEESYGGDGEAAEADSLSDVDEQQEEEARPRASHHRASCSARSSRSTRRRTVEAFSPPWSR